MEKGAGAVALVLIAFLLVLAFLNTGSQIFLYMIGLGLLVGCFGSFAVRKDPDDPANRPPRK